MKMPFVDRLERRLGWIAIPGIFRFFALLHVLAFILQLLRPDGIGALFEFDREKIMEGEIWRIVTFFFADNKIMGSGMFLAIVFLFIFVQLMFLISDALEGVWGSFRTTLFFFTGCALLIASNFLLPLFPFGGIFVYDTAFLAFATYFPRVELRLYFVLPVQVRYIAWAITAYILYLAIKTPIYIPFLLAAHANYLLFVGIPWLRGHRKVVESAIRRREFQRKAAIKSFHRCHTCGKTENDDPSLEFRVGTDGEEYCTDHLPPY